MANRATGGGGMTFKSIDVTFHGIKELDRKLGELPKRIENRVLQKAVTKAMREGRNIVKAAAPRAEGDRSPPSKKYGSLRRNIRVIRLKRVRKGQKGARIDTGNAFWGVFYEKGTRRQPARPWFLPAFKRAQEVVLSALKRELGNGIEAEARKR